MPAKKSSPHSAKKSPKKPAKPLQKSFDPLKWFRITASLLAMLCGVTLGLIFWLVGLHQSVRELKQPRVNLPVLNLIPTSTGAETINPLADGGPWVLVLSPPPQPSPFPAYKITLKDHEDQDLWIHAIEPNPTGQFVVQFPARSLATGDYTLTLNGLQESQEQPVATYPLQVLPPQMATPPPNKAP